MGAPIEEYSRAIEELGLVPHLRLKAEDEREGLAAITDAVLRSVFYSRPDSHRHTARSMLTNGHIDDKDSMFQDYIQMLNIGNLAGFMDGFYNGEVGAQSLMEIRRRELDGAVGMYSWMDLRAWRVKVGREGIFMSPPETEVMNNLERVAGMLNRKVKNEAEAVANIASFFLEFIKLHPFDEGNGRSGRIITNTYLLKHGLKQSLVTKEPLDNDTNLKATDLFSFSGYKGAYIAWMLTSMIGGEKMGKVVEELKNVKTDNPFTISLRDSILVNLGVADKDELAKNVEMLYNKGKKSNVNLVHAALWIAWRAGIDSPIIEDAARSGNQKVRATAMHVMESVNFERYKEMVRNLAHNGAVADRIAAIGILGRQGVVDEGLMQKVFDRNPDFGVNCAIGVYLRRIDSSDSIGILRSLMGHHNKNLRVRGYHAAVAYGSEEDLRDILESRIHGESPEIVKAIVEETSRTDRINSSPAAVESLSRYMLDDAYIRGIVLGELSGKQSINSRYVEPLDTIIRAEGFSDTDRAFAMYLVGRETGFEKLVRDYGKGFSGANSTLENMALAMVYIKDLKAGRIGTLDGLKPMDDEMFNFAIALMVSRSGFDEKKVVEKLLEIEERQVHTKHSASFYDVIPLLIEGVQRNGHAAEIRGSLRDSARQALAGLTRDSANGSAQEKQQLRPRRVTG
ncbi:MAG: Fic family protein [Candidatus Micrarchaeota archaeon]|nr:Fic family protein [Candidatus Micrarchaeota archaeon]